ncbi:MAG: ABC transporter permease subunit [FCB group bacterium]|nr:ABC transporter permease subunit [FCB group bacterium]
MSADDVQAAEALRADAADQLPRSGYAGAILTSFQHTLSLLRRHRWSIFGILLAFLPVLIPIVTSLFDAAATVPRGIDIFTQLTEKLYLNVIAPLFALFFGCMLIADDVENHTLQYILTRPVPRSAAVFGRFAAYFVFVSAVLISSLVFAFAACTTLGNFSATAGNLRLLAHYIGVLLAALATYGALSMCLGAYFSKRPVVYGIVYFFGWQHVAMILPGIADFLTVRKYLNAILPPLATQRDNPALQITIAEFQKTEYAVGAGKSILILAAITLAFLLLTALILRLREYTPARAAGA